MLKASISRFVRSDVTKCVECVMEVDRFLYNTAYTYAVRRLGEGVYEVVFRWKKLGITRFYRVKLSVVKRGNIVEYVSVDGSDYPFKMRFVFESRDGGTVIKVESEMKAGIMADVLGRKDYRRFIEELVDSGIKAFLEKSVKEVRSRASTGKASCTNCVLYDELRGYCYFLNQEVKDPSNPPCHGEGYVAYKAV